MNALLLALLLGQPIRLPETIPPPRPSGPVNTLAADSLYVVDSDVEVAVLSSPAGIVKSETMSGPIRVRAKFADGTGLETRTFNGKSVTLVEPIASGTVELLIVPMGLKNEAEIVRRTIKVGAAPQPPPSPTPPAPVPPKPVSGLRVLVTYESGSLSAMPSGQVAIFTAGAVREYLNAKCVLGPDGKTKEWRFWDRDVDTANESAFWKKAMATPPAPNMVTVYDAEGSLLGQFPLPAAVADMLAELRKYGG